MTVLLQVATGIDPLSAVLVGAIIAAFVGNTVISWQHQAATRRDVAHLCEEVKVLNELHPPTHEGHGNPVEERCHDPSSFCGNVACLTRTVALASQRGKASSG